MTVDVPALLARHFAPAYAKGLRYHEQGRVRLIEHDAAHAVGDVQGMRVRPYRVRVRLDAGPREPKLIGDCTCPLGAACKHVVALALAWQARLAHEDPSGASTGEPDPWRAWLAVREAPAPEPLAEGTVFYCCRVADAKLYVRAVVARPSKDGWTVGRKVDLLSPRFDERLRERPREDRTLLRCLADADSQLLDDETDAWARVDGNLVEMLLATDRMRWEDARGTPLRAGEARELGFAWSVQDDGTQVLAARAGKHGVAFGELLDWYVDVQAGAIGRVRSAVPVEQRHRLQSLPPVRPEHVEGAARAFAEAGLGALPPLKRFELRRATAAPRARVVLLRPPLDHRADRLPFGVAATLAFLYDGTDVDATDTRRALRRRTKDVVTIVTRDDAFEASMARFLGKEGFVAEEVPVSGTAHRWLRRRAMAGPEIAEWLQGFVARAVAVLLDVETDPYFPVQAGPDLGIPEMSVEDEGDGWFATRIGISIDGERVDLLPLLLRALDDPAARSSHGLAVTLPSGRRVVVPQDRVASFVAIIADLERRGDAFGVPRAKLAAIVPPPDWRFLPGERTRAFLAELERFEGVEPVETPPGFNASLRPYQSTGLAWLDFLRRYGFGGVLADDMGLGKTVQVLAFIARERALGRLQQPTLVVCPTSVAPNWLAETQRFAPALRVALLARGDRAPLLATLTDYDIVITSYALMLRDIDTLAEQPWSLLVLDESQWLKNRTSQGFRAALQLRAAQTICLTGTPVENHLDELKAQFDLAMPGLLGDERSFKQRFRTPIERERSTEASAELRQRLRPFLLRRRKADVASELPPRTSIDVPVELGEAQRDLYETIRARMESRVREALAERGLGRSNITVLDALLKLRQVCCDPQLVDLPQATRVEASAKRETLNDMLPTMVEDGRAVLVFSQFTSMLDLIEADLKERKLKFDRLDGSTRDRRAPVRRFQAGEVPILLLSLKAGGVGLNLTRADTVVLYDPWWNPAAEAQAIDRAHRIGQDKPVFVYQLVCKDTVEERMQALKSRKRAVADAVLEGGDEAIEKLDAADLVALFAAG